MTWSLKYFQFLTLSRVKGKLRTSLSAEAIVVKVNNIRSSSFFIDAIISNGYKD